MRIDEHDAIFADRADRELGLERRSELPNHYGVERKVQRSRDFVRDDHAAARQADDERILPSEVRKRRAEPPSRVVPVAKQAAAHHGPHVPRRLPPVARVARSPIVPRMLERLLMSEIMASRRPGVIGANA